MSFRLIAIRPLEGCIDKFLKNLEIGKIYPLYSEYEYAFENGDPKAELLSIAPKASSVPSDFYDINNLSINISAIVGKNGSGKSSILELFFWAINNFATNFLYESQEKQKTHSITANLKQVEGIFVEFYFTALDEILNEDHDGNKRKDKEGLIIEKTNYYKIKIGSAIEKKPNYEAYRMEDGEFRLLTEKDAFGLKDLFYTEVVNYSHYAYNSKELDFWIDGLFHKNDSYQTPLVLNPMRTEGNFDINRENDLLRQRLLANILRPSAKDGSADFRNFGDNLKADHLLFSLKDKKQYVEYGYDKNTDKPHTIHLRIFELLELEDKLVEELVRYYLKDSTALVNTERPYYQEVRSYILYKIVSISEKYKEYNDYFPYFKKADRQLLLKSKGKISDAKNIEKIIFDIGKNFDYKFLKNLADDTSHITFKLKQSLNYLINGTIDYPLDEPVTIEGLSNKIFALKSGRKLIELLPPPIFKVDIILKSLRGDDKKDIFMERLSSGEKQLIYSVSSILYHLSNLNSVSENKVQYRYINLVLEEIELYFHPEYQKKYVDYLRTSIGRLGLDKIKAINIILATHSPFILSDIPKQNILYLDINKESGFSKPLDYKKMKSFGANISDLLADSFFITDGLVGDFAKIKIQEALSWLHKEGKIIKDMKSEPRNLKRFSSRAGEQKYYKQIIELVDEPLVKQKLRSMYLAFVTDDQRAKEEEIARLEEAITKLKKDKDA
ncbi:AAA family ATPase [Flavobacterium beibuense]|uniref:AAA domain protein n=1 Tax=Flavobacterium beibuense TaxID=657326 RepID=A0A444WEI7_9FLAO|nr:AAA family ATPase [Flavobacterium beibuense]RYJ44271.1 AAA domain protein [Flavobacterium beibuense]